MNNDRLIEEKLKELSQLVKTNDGAIKSLVLYVDCDDSVSFICGTTLKGKPEDFDHFANLIKKKLKILNLKYCFKYWWDNF